MVLSLNLISRKKQYINQVVLYLSDCRFASFRNSCIFCVSEGSGPPVVL